MENLHFYVDAIALGIAILTLIPVYREVGKGFFLALAAVLLLCVIGISTWIHFDHRAKIETTKDHIKMALSTGPKTIDEITHDLTPNEVSRANEALQSLLDSPASGVWYGSVHLEGCTGGVSADVVKYYLRSLETKK